MNHTSLRNTPRGPSDRDHSGISAPAHAPHVARQSRSLLVGVLLISLLTACAEEPLPQRKISPSDCLSDVHMDRLKESLARCDKVVAAYPNDPLPLNERYLLHTLAEDDKAACRDIARASALALKIPAQRLDPLLRHDLQLRQADCRTILPMTGQIGRAHV